jgi:hypothetical protein
LSVERGAWSVETAERGHEVLGGDAVAAGLGEELADGGKEAAV